MSRAEAWALEILGSGPSLVDIVEASRIRDHVANQCARFHVAGKVRDLYRQAP